MSRSGRGPLRLRALVRGEVQGVGYRWAVQRQAHRLGLTGYAENLPDGSVRIEAEGDPARLDELEAFLRGGPRFAEVQRLDSERVAATGEFHGFATR
jgi:acylphosphatase